MGTLLRMGGRPHCDRSSSGARARSKSCMGQTLSHRSTRPVLEGQAHLPPSQRRGAFLDHHRDEERSREEPPQDQKTCRCGRHPPSRGRRSQACAKTEGPPLGGFLPLLSARARQFRAVLPSWRGGQLQVNRSSVRLVASTIQAARAAADALPFREPARRRNPPRPAPLNPREW
jgi:hypothetical protein